MTINRRDFLKIGSLPLVVLFRPKPIQQDYFDIQAAFENAGNSGRVDIPPGVHEVTRTLIVKSWMTIHGNNAILNPVGDFSGSPVMNFSGAYNTNVHALRILSSANASNAVRLSRAASGHGAGNKFYDCFFQGSFSESVVYSNSEGNSYTGCQFVTENENPALIYQGSNTLGWWNGCSFRNYGKVEDVPLVKLLGTTSGLSFRDCYFFVGRNGKAVRVNGSSQGVTIHDCRVEGDGSDCLLIDNEQGSSFLFQYDVARLNYTAISDYVIRSRHHLLECNFDFIHGCNATKYFHELGGGKIWRCRIAGNKTDWVKLEGTSQTRMNHLIWVGGVPVMYGPNDNVIHSVG